MTNAQLMQAAQMAMTRQNITAGSPALPVISNINARSYMLNKVSSAGTIPDWPSQSVVSVAATEAAVQHLEAASAMLKPVVSFIASGLAVEEHTN